jgi:hypothetical protein
MNHDFAHSKAGLVNVLSPSYGSMRELMLKKRGRLTRMRRWTQDDQAIDAAWSQEGRDSGAHARVRRAVLGLWTQLSKGRN